MILLLVLSSGFLGLSKLIFPSFLDSLSLSRSLSLSVSVTLSSLLAPLSFVVTYHPCRHTPHSIKSLFPASRRQHSLHPSSVLSLSLLSLSSPCHGGENLPASVILSLYLSLPFSFLYFPAVGPPQKHTHTHPFLVRRWADSPSLWAVVWLARPVSFIADKEAHSNVPSWSTERPGLEEGKKKKRRGEKVRGRAIRGNR